MSKGKPKKKKKKKRKGGRVAIPAPEKTEHRYRRIVGIVILPLFERGLDTMGYSNPSLAWVIWGVTAMLSWWFIYTSKTAKHAIKARPKVKAAIWPVYVLIALSFGCKALYSWGHNQPTNTEVMEAIKDRDKETADGFARVMGTLSEMGDKEEDRLEKDYPLGYVMIAFSGHHKGVIPHSNVVDANWNDITVTIDKQNVMQVEIPYLLDKRSGSSLENCALGTLAIPGSSFTWSFKDSLTMRLECLQAQPVGIFAVLGFTAYTEEGTRKK